MNNKAHLSYYPIILYFTYVVGHINIQPLCDILKLTVAHKSTLFPSIPDVHSSFLENTGQVQFA